MLAIDFSTFYVKSVTPDQAAAIKEAAFSHLILGYDDTQESHAVRKVFIDAGFSLDVYRFDYSRVDVDSQVKSILDAVHHSPEPLPGYIWLDIEPSNGASPSIANIERAMDDIEAADVRSEGTLVKPGIYTGEWVWEQFYANYTGPADRKWALWTTQRGGNTPDTVHTYGGWPQESIQGVQYQQNVPTSGILVDFSNFRDRTPAPPSAEPETTIRVKVVNGAVVVTVTTPEGRVVQI